MLAIPYLHNCSDQLQATLVCLEPDVLVSSHSTHSIQTLTLTELRCHDYDNTSDVGIILLMRNKQLYKQLHR